MGNKGKELNWEHVYDLKDIAYHLKKESKRRITELGYKFDLFFNDNDLLKANNFEYINDTRSQFKLNLDKTKIYENTIN